MRLLFLLLPAAVGATAPGVPAQTTPDFSGVWKQADDRCIPKRTGEVILHIDQRTPELILETSVTHGSAIPRKALQRYTTDGKVSITTGVDGDEFHTSIIWSGQSLVFSVEEHEAGRVIWSKETWTLLEDGATLQRTREQVDGGKKQILVYLRQQPAS